VLSHFIIRQKGSDGVHFDYLLSLTGMFGASCQVPDLRPMYMLLQKTRRSGCTLSFSTGMPTYSPTGGPIGRRPDLQYLIWSGHNCLPSIRICTQSGITCVSWTVPFIVFYTSSIRLAPYPILTVLYQCLPSSDGCPYTATRSR